VKKRGLVKAPILLEKIDSLYSSFPHFEKIIEHIEELTLLQREGDNTFYVPPLLMAGGPGTGKTFFCHTLSSLINTHFEVVNMEGLSSNFFFKGSHRTWSNAEAGFIFNILTNEDIHNLNPIFLLDEIDKTTGSEQYNPLNSLLPLLERYTAKKFKDEYIPIEIDASHIVWFATANNIDKLSSPIKSRFDIFQVPNPTLPQRKVLIKEIYNSIRSNNSWGGYFSTEVPNESLDILANIMTNGGVRDLRKLITTAFAKAKKDNNKEITPCYIEKYSQQEKMPWDK